MTGLTPSRQHQLHRYADDALTPSDRDELTAELRDNKAARDYLSSIEEVGTMTRVALEDASQSVDFDALEDRIMAAVSAPQTSATSDPDAMTLMRWADNALQDPHTVRNVFRTLADDPRAQDAVEGQREIGRLTRQYVQNMDDEVDFHALEERCMAVLDHPSSRSSESGTPRATVTPFQPWYSRFKAPIAALAGIAAATLIILPLTLGGTNAGPQGAAALNRVDSMQLDPGYSGKIIRGTSKSAPVVWISQDDAPTAKSIRKNPIVPARVAPATTPDEASHDAADASNQPPHDDTPVEKTTDKPATAPITTP